MTNQVNQEALIANEFNKQYPYDDMNGWDRKLFKSGYQAATQASESEINSLKQRVESYKSALEAALEEKEQSKKDERTAVTHYHELQADNLRLREALELVDGHLKVHRYMVSGNVQEAMNKVISSTPTQSLAEHDNATIERIATTLENAEGELKYLPEYVALVRSLKSI